MTARHLVGGLAAAAVVACALAPGAGPVVVGAVAVGVAAVAAAWADGGRVRAVAAVLVAAAGAALAWPDPRPYLPGVEVVVDVGAVDLADDPAMPSVPFAVEVLGADVERVRLAAFEHFDGRRWSARSPTGPHPVPARRGVEVRVRHPALGGLVAVPGVVVGGEGLAARGGDAVGVAPGPVDARLVVRPDGPRGALRLDPVAQAAHLALPEAVAPEVRAVAEVGSGLEPAAAVAAVADAVRERVRYGPDAPVPGDGLGPFLRGEVPGDCERAATAAALALRVAGVPSRVVTGWTNGVAVPGGVRFDGARGHVWVEGHVAGLGWVGVDPTPSASPVEGDGLRWVGAGIGALALGLGVAAVVLLAPRRELSPPDDPWHRLLHRLGARPGDAPTDLRLAASLGTAHPEHATSLRALAEARTRARFGG